MMIALVSVVDWFSLGLILGVKYYILEGIRHDNRNHAHQCKLEMLVAWLKSSMDCNKHQLSTALWYTTNAMLVQK